MWYKLSCTHNRQILGDQPPGYKHRMKLPQTSHMFLVRTFLPYCSLKTQIESQQSGK